MDGLGRQGPRPTGSRTGSVCGRHEDSGGHILPMIPKFYWFIHIFQLSWQYSANKYPLPLNKDVMWCDKPWGCRRTYWCRLSKQWRTAAASSSSTQQRRTAGAYRSSIQQRRTAPWIRSWEEKYTFLLAFEIHIPINSKWINGKRNIWMNIKSPHFVTINYNEQN